MAVESFDDDVWCIKWRIVPRYTYVTPLLLGKIMRAAYCDGAHHWCGCCKAALHSEELYDL
jgi:hypothetical protein